MDVFISDSLRNRAHNSAVRVALAKQVVPVWYHAKTTRRSKDFELS
jgi:hypothetical protein